MDSTQQALKKLLASVNPVDAETIQTSKSLGRVLAQDVVAHHPSPRFANSSMDGFALRAEDSQGASIDNPVKLRVANNAPAGSKSHFSIKKGEVARIMTGAVLPDGVDAVIPVEDTDQPFYPGQKLPEQVEIHRTLEPNAYVRQVGEDYPAGAKLAQAGSVITPRTMALLAQLGLEKINVFRQIKVGLFSSGDEIVLPGKQLERGQTYDANTPMLSALFAQLSVQVINLGIAPDTLAGAQRCLERALENDVDLIVSSAGVSVGVYDYVRTAVELRGKVDAWKVNMRPGKPLAFGSYSGTPFVGLPGNPASSFVSFEVFIRPLVHHMSGNRGWHRIEVEATLAQPVESDGRESYLRVNLEQKNGELKAVLAGHQGSSNIHGLSMANGLAVIPVGVKSLDVNSTVKAWLLT
jgi:molybdopterin molybdotransferase